ncbi:MAG: hypothetical protein HN580_08405 [Deltaproteobacteria bacterium]|jgi:hypothetical protein|nr:hypothetical protein [Deltaproteobacteria bacterium]MBT4089424.1 hypothetical protein [Deltaproteobacteria bacterium]MBT4269262.1 hypothetical protein [Deltaproteobacteria bacterium]MBT4639223.1 hypothetical protein [Deltaproteobacteria bacterium]MBT6500119.1 hypothetical protein [Deltaproteobacteria bacterium]
MRFIQSFPRILIISVLCFYSVSAVFAQNTGYLEDNSDSLWEEQGYLDSTGREFETSDSQYVGEQEIKEAEEARRRSGLPSVDLAAALEQDKELMPDNIIYGIGTGAVIGGWLALVQGENARDNVRFLSVGIISGVLLGMAVGTKSLYIEQNQPISRLENTDVQAPGKATSPPFHIDFIRKQKETLAQLNFQIKF